MLAAGLMSQPPLLPVVVVVVVVVVTWAPAVDAGEHVNAEAMEAVADYFLFIFENYLPKVNPSLNKYLINL
jgi:cytochrome c oxidase assembly factor CtaG